MVTQTKSLIKNAEGERGVDWAVIVVWLHAQHCYWAILTSLGDES